MFRGLELSLVLEEKTQERGAGGRRRGEPASGETESGEPRKETRERKWHRNSWAGWGGGGGGGRCN